MTVTVERAPDVDEPDETIVSELREALKDTTSLTCRVELRDYDTLERFQLKADRFTDERP